MSKRTDAPLGAPEDHRLALGRAIRAARWPMTQANVGTLVGTPQSVVSTWETGRIPPSIDRIVELDALFGRPRGALLVDSGLVSQEAIGRSTQTTASGEPFQELDDGGAMADFPVLLGQWLSAHQPIIDCLASVRGLPDGEPAVAALRAIGPVVELRVALGIFFAFRGECAATQILGRFLGPLEWQRLWAAISDASSPAAS